MTSLKELPDSLICEIHNQINDSESKKSFSLIDKHIRGIALERIKRIRISSENLYDKERAFLFPKMPTDILVKVICRYPNLEKISFRFLSILDENFINVLATYFEKNSNKPPLNLLKKISFFTQVFPEKEERKKIKNFCFILFKNLNHEDLIKEFIIKLDYNQEKVLNY